MKIAEMNWMDVEAAAARDPRCIVPIGSTEQHAQLSLCVDGILAEKVSLDAATPLDIPVFPVPSFSLPTDGLRAPRFSHGNSLPRFVRPGASRQAPTRLPRLPR